MNDGDDPNPFALEDAWMPALLSFDRDQRPLAQLLASDLPIPRGVRSMLAQMIDPDGPAYLYHRLKLERAGTDRNCLELDLKKLEVATEYKRLVDEGLSKIKARATLSEKYSVDEKTIKNQVKHVENLKSWLKCESAQHPPRPKPRPRKPA